LVILSDLVPIKTVAYFMNQPIIRDYLANIENKGFWLFIDSIATETMDEYKTTKVMEVLGIPSEQELYKMLPLIRRKQR
jgi:hypothetical protein